MSILRQLAISVILVSILFGTWYGYTAIAPQSIDGGQGGPAGALGRPALVSVAPVTLTRSGDSIRAVGTGRAAQSVTLYPLASGTVAEILFAAGDAVTAGMPLLRLDDDAEAIELSRSEAELANAEQILARYERLAPTGAIPATDLDEARTAVALARADRAAAALALDRRTVRAPFDGVTGLVEVSIGDFVTTATPISTIDDRSEILVEFQVSESYASRIAPGLAVTATTPALPGEVFRGDIGAVDSRLDELSRTLRVRAALPNPQDRLRPGMSFVVTLAFPGEPRTSVPAIALQWDRDGAHVWAVRDEVARRVAAEVIERSGDNVLVEAALDEGDLVIIEGMQRVTDGTPVAVAAAEPAGGDPLADRPQG